MKPKVWLVAEPEALRDLTAALRADGVEVTRTPVSDLERVAAAAYDGRGLLLVDARGAAGRDALEAEAAAALPVVALAGSDAVLPSSVLALPADQPTEALSHHVREVLSHPENLRRHPRVRVSMPADVDDAPGWTLCDASLYGMWLEPAGDLREGAEVRVRVHLEDGATAELDGRVIAIRGAGAAVRCRPVSDEDLLLWIHLILGGLVQSPLHAEVDPFGPLFE